MDEEILDYNEQKEGWVSKMVDWQKKHISDRQIFPARHRARNTAAAHFGIQPEHLQPALPALPDCGHLPHHALY